jgi:hypothetical protein
MKAPSGEMIHFKTLAMTAEKMSPAAQALHEGSSDAGTRASRGNETKRLQ